MTLAQVNPSDGNVLEHLNNKADRDFNNIEEPAWQKIKDSTAHDTSAPVELPTGNGKEYTPLADGYLFVAGAGNSDFWVSIDMVYSDNSVLAISALGAYGAVSARVNRNQKYKYSTQGSGAARFVPMKKGEN